MDPWAGDLRLVDQVLQDDDFSAFLKHAEVPVPDKIRAVDTVLRDVHPLVRNLIDVLITRGLVDLLPELRQAYGEFLDEHRGLQRVEVISAIPLENRELERITRFLSDLIQTEAVVTTQVDQSILAGVVIRIGDQLLDGSTRARLEGMRNQFHSGGSLSRV